MSGYVYFLAEQDRGYVKIGTAKNVEGRAKMLQTGCPESLVVLGVLPHPRPRLMEAHLHRMFRKDRLRGEWFTPSAGIMDFIEVNTFSIEGERTWEQLYDQGAPDIEGAWDWV